MSIATTSGSKEQEGGVTSVATTTTLQVQTSSQVQEQEAVNNSQATKPEEGWSSLVIHHSPSLSDHNSQATKPEEGWVIILLIGHLPFTIILIITILSDHYH